MSLSPCSIHFVLGLEEYCLGLTFEERNGGPKVVQGGTERVQRHLDNCTCQKMVSKWTQYEKSESFTSST